MTIGFDKVFGVHANALMLHAKRAEVLANNLANADTPGFKAKDIDFKTILKDVAAGQKGQHVGLTQNNGKHIAGMNTIKHPQLIFRDALQDSLDGNTVYKQVETAMFMRNALQYQTSLKFLNGSIKSIMTAIKGE